MHNNALVSALSGQCLHPMSSENLSQDFVSLFVIALAALLAPLLSSATRKRVPDVVWLLILGVIIGPSVLGIAQVSDSVHLLREIGMGILFLIAGTEINISQVRAKPGRVAAITWLICFLAAFALAVVTLRNGDYSSAIALAIAFTSTALGTLLPILMEAGMMGKPAGEAVLIHGAIGELAPVIAMSLLLGTRSPGWAAVILVFFVVATLISVAIPTRFILRHPEIGRVILRGAQTSSKTLMRVVMAILTGLMALSAVLNLDIVLGAFAAGVVVHALSPVNFSAIEGELRTIGFSFLIPVFFVTSGMNISLSAVIERPWLLVAFVTVILVVRGLPIVLIERFVGTVEKTTWRDATRIGLYGATGLPIIVAVTGVAVNAGVMAEDIGSILVASGAASVLFFPLLASLENKVFPSRALVEAE